MEFSTEIKKFKEILGISLQGFFKRFSSFFFCFAIISLLEIILLWLIHPQLFKNLLNNNLPTNVTFLFFSGLIVIVFSIWKFLALASIRERIDLGIASALIKSLAAFLRIILPSLLIASIGLGFLLLTYHWLVVLILFLIYFWIIFSSYIALSEKKSGFSAFVRSFYLLQKIIFKVYWYIIGFLFLLFLMLFPFIALTLFLYLQVNAIIGILLGTIILIIFFLLANIYLSVIFENAWLVKKYITFSNPTPLFLLAVYIFLIIALLTLVIGIGIFK